ncbi:MAG: CRISPR-associated protein Csx11 [Firmicutes bacterium]|nr:CRISPR-associated protein Csx11 [Bacillota bacterium]
MAGSLEILKQHQKDLLLAEVAAWLHDCRKCSDENVRSQAAPPIGSNLPWRCVLDRLDPNLSIFQRDPIPPVRIGNLISEGGHGGVEDSSQPWAVLALRRCHKAAHVEKEEPASKDDGKQPADDTRPSSPFGFEGSALKDLTKQLEDLPWEKLQNRSEFRKAAQLAFSKALGDTRRPINEVDLWSWVHIVATLYKAALAGILLTIGRTEDLPVANTLKWRLLALRFNSSQIVDRSPSISALLARRAWINEGLDKVESLLEETYPLGTEVYRDANGSVFVVPDVEDLLDYANENGQTLRVMIQSALDSVLEGEIIITPQIDTNGWWAQDPKWTPKSKPDELDDQPLPITEWLKEKRVVNPDLAWTKSSWKMAADNGKPSCEPCLISGVRPQGPSQKAIERKVSDFWLDRIGKRSKEWAEKPESTIWMSEIADINGRVALIAASLDISHWLTPDGLVNTLLVIPPQQGDPKSAKRKTPSFARLRRVWKTCEGFWEESVKGQLGGLLDTIGPRLTIAGDLDRSLAPYQAYEIYPRPGISLEVMLDKRNLVAIANLQYVARQVGADTEDYSTPDRAAQCLAKQLGEREEIVIYEPGLSDGRQKVVAHLRNIRVMIRQDNYVPAIDILSEPQQFMVLVPAAKGLEVIHHIKSEYEAKFSKVKNRLPLHLSIVFFGRKQPLYTAVDAARRMLRRSSSVGTVWLVEKVVDQPDSHIVKMTLSRTTEEAGLPQLNSDFETEISYGTGAGTEDDWYPYVFVQDTATNKPLSDRHFVFQAHLPGHAVETPLVHVKELQEGDKIHYAPSTFDFEFLDVTARRFELLYDEVTGMRLLRAHETYTTRPFLLEDLDVMRDLWSVIAENTSNRRTITQLQQITGLIETTRLDWQIPSPDDSTLGKFAEHVLRRSFGKLWNRITETRRNTMIRWATWGRWRDLMELYLSILKWRWQEATVEELKEGLV